jgi:nucleotide-binding universal stress UspA family protein
MLVSMLDTATAQLPMASRSVLSVAAPDVTAHQERLEAVLRGQTRLREAGFCVEGRVLDGDAREQMMELLDQERVDLLVLGCRGRGSLARLMLGSVSSYAVGHAPCSVLVVKQDRR